MARTQTNTVEYFPHIAKTGKTIFILEGQFGNDGYAFWFKLLEVLATSEDHVYDASNETNWQYLVAKMRLSEISVTEILSLLAKLGNIDTDLWENDKIIWCQALVDNVSDVYKKRKRDLPKKPKTSYLEQKSDNCHRNSTTEDIPVTEMPQSKVKESKVKESILLPPRKTSASKKIKIPLPDNFSISDEVKLWAEKHGWTDIEQHLEPFIDLCRSNGYTAVDWDAKFKRAIREDWGKVREGNGNGSRAGPGPSNSDIERARQWAIRTDAEREKALHEKSGIV